MNRAELREICLAIDMCDPRVDFERANKVLWAALDALDEINASRDLDAADAEDIGERMRDALKLYDGSWADCDKERLRADEAEADADLQREKVTRLERENSALETRVSELETQREEAKTAHLADMAWLSGRLNELHLATKGRIP